MKRDRIKDALDRGYDDITAGRVIQSFARVDLQRHVIWTRHPDTPWKNNWDA